MPVCLPKEAREKLLNALKTKEVDLENLFTLSSKERNSLFLKYVGENASFVNGKFEQAMLSNQKLALSRWIKNTTSFKDPIRRDLLKKVDRIERFLTKDEQFGFLQDVASQKLGINVTEKEAKTILKLHDDIQKAKELIVDNSPRGSQERLNYGYRLALFQDYVGNLKLVAKDIKPKEYFYPQNWGRALTDFAGVTKSLVATLDNSFIGRQGIKTLLAGEYKIWADTATYSFKLFGKELRAKSPGFLKERGNEVMLSIRADILSRPNALNGKYRAAKNGYGLNVLQEEAFPSSFPERVPLLGRIFKASETAFNGSALKMRADLADAVIANAEKNGIDMLDEAQATAFGNLVSSMTGRGELKTTAPIARELNVAFFSVRFLKSNFNTLTGHLLDSTMTREARVVAAINTLKIAASLTALLSFAKMLNPDSVDFDPRSTRFGKIKIGNRNYDITGGMAGLVTLGARLFPTYHNGEWGMWDKSTLTGKYTKLSSGRFGTPTALDKFEQFFEGKLAPTAGAVRDILKGQNFSGKKPSFVNTTIGLITPISVSTLTSELQSGNDGILFAMIAEALGISPSTTTFRGYGKKFQELKDTRGSKVYNQALKEITTGFNKQINLLEKSPAYKKMDNEQRAKKLDSIRTLETKRVLSKYGL